MYIEAKLSEPIEYLLHFGQSAPSFSSSYCSVIADIHTSSYDSKRGFSLVSLDRNGKIFVKEKKKNNRRILWSTSLNTPVVIAAKHVCYSACKAQSVHPTGGTWEKYTGRRG